MQEEQVLHISMPSILTSVDLDEDLHEQRLQGGAAIQTDAGWGLSNDLSYMSIHDLEKQAHLSGRVIQIVTSQRQLNVIALRPID